MKTNSSRDVRRLRRALLSACALSAMIAGSAIAQDGQTTPPSETEEAEPAVEEIVVVGSRIRRDTFNSTSPIQVITRNEATLAGLSTAAEILQGNQVAGGAAQINNAFGGYVVDGGPGVNTISLRGLGAGRTLVLINNRRVTPAGTRGAVGSADLNVLPNAMIERVDVLRDGASSIYGSDAIAGVVNVITRTDIEGVTVEGQFNRPFHDGGERGRFSIVGGLQGDRWNASGSIEYYERGELTLGDRDWASDCPVDLLTDPETGESLDYIDPLTGQPKCWTLDSGGVTINTLGTRLRPGVGAPGATPNASYNRWRPNPAVVGGEVPGFEGVGGSGSDLNVRDTFDPRMLEQSLISPVQIWTGFGQASYELDVLGNAEVYGEVLLNRRDSEQTGYRQLSLDYPATSPLVPAALQNDGALFGSELHDGPGLRAFIGFGNDLNEQRVDYYKANAGIRGDITFLPDWKYDLSASYARSDADYTFESFITSALSNSVNVVAAPAGTPANLTRLAADGTRVMCAITATDPSAGCVPAPILNAQTLRGELPADWVDYVWRPITGTTVYDELAAAFYVDGPLAELPAGEVLAAFGLEYREAEIDDTPAEESQNGDLLNLTSAAVTRGSDSVIEAYGEVDVPLLKGMPFVEELSVNSSLRYTDYESYGSDWTYKVGGVYRPLDWLTFRATYGTSYRAPALFEQFQGATSGFLSSASDPCNEWGTADNPNLRANCAAEGLAQDFLATNGIVVLSQGGADTGLEAETSDNLTLGMILQPELPDGFGEFAFAVDYFSIEINNGVAQAGAGNILELCYNDPDFRAGGGLCNLVTRDAVSRQLTVVNSYTNIATQVSEGWDFNMRWTGDVGPGQLRLNAEVTRYISQASNLFPDDPLEEVNGTLNNPEMTGAFDVTYGFDAWTFRYGVDWIAAMDSYAYFGLEKGNTIYDLDVGDYFLHRLSVQYAQDDDWSLTVGVRNLLDEEPPAISSGIYNIVGNAPLYSGYDYVGRELFVTFTKSF